MMIKIKKGLNSLFNKGIKSTFHSFQQSMKRDQLSDFRVINHFVLNDKSIAETEYKEKNICVISDYSYGSNETTEEFRQLIELLNQNGIAIHYFFVQEGTVTIPNEMIFPLVVHEKFHTLNIEYDLYIDNCRSDLINKETLKNNTIKKISINNPFNTDKLLKEILGMLYLAKQCNGIFFKNISIIVLNYNNLSIIEKCIESLLQYNVRYGYEIIVVDNGSTDGSYEVLISKYKDRIKILKNSQNGCSSGRNLGREYSDRDYLLFLDSDQWCLNNYWLEPYITIVEKNSNFGLIGWAGGWLDNKGYSLITTDDFPLRYLSPARLFRTDVQYLGSGGMLVKKDIFDFVRGFDINYDPTGYEDTDISFKMKEKALKLLYCSYLGIMHLPHQTTRSGSKEHDIQLKKNGNYFTKKWRTLLEEEKNEQ